VNLTALYELCRQVRFVYVVQSLYSAYIHTSGAFITPTPSPSLLETGRMHAALPRPDYYESV